MARVLRFVDEDGNWWINDMVEWIKVSPDKAVLERSSTPKLSQRLSIAWRVVKRRKNAKRSK